MSRMSGYGLTIIRVVLGIIFLVHGAHKVFGWETGSLGPGGLSNTLAGMGEMGMPPVIVYLVSFGELLGGLGLIVGLLSRFAAAGILVIMLGAIFIVHLPHGFFLNYFYLTEGVHHGYEFSLALAAMALGLALAGPGRCALDNLSGKKAA